MRITTRLQIGVIIVIALTITASLLIIGSIRIDNKLNVKEKLVDGIVSNYELFSLTF